jgi:long-chain acyl-CoA synthetase
MALCQVEGDMSVGNCGGAGASVELCLRDVPDMDYFSTDKPHARGELLIRGHTVFREYLKNDKETSKAIDSEGWFSTGDVCKVDELGRFAVIDRVKNLLKLAQGEYISPERIENVYLANLGFLQTAYVHGDSDKSSLVGIFGIEPQGFAPFASKVLGKEISMMDTQAIEAACKDEKVLKAVLNQFERIAKENKFMRYERCRALALFREPFSLENELMTPT